MTSATPPQPAPSAFKTSASRLASARAYKRKHRSALLEWQSQYNKSVLADPVLRAKKNKSQRETRKRYAAKYATYDRARDRIKERARQMIRERVYDGRLKRGRCMICQKPNAEAHHEVYEKPLQIHWLCRKHHAAAHLNPVILLTVEPVHVR